MVLSKVRIVTFWVAELAVPGCEGPSTMVKSPTYAVMSRVTSEMKGGSQKVTNDDEGGQDPPQK